MSTVDSMVPHRPFFLTHLYYFSLRLCCSDLFSSLPGSLDCSKKTFSFSLQTILFRWIYGTLSAFAIATQLLVLSVISVLGPGSRSFLESLFCIRFFLLCTSVTKDFMNLVSIIDVNSIFFRCLRVAHQGAITAIFHMVCRNQSRCE